MNLCANASQALQDTGGSITVSLNSIELFENVPNEPMRPIWRQGSSSSLSLKTPARHSQRTARANF
jgi:hypothetical protein